VRLDSPSCSSYTSRIVLTYRVRLIQRPELDGSKQGHHLRSVLESVERSSGYGQLVLSIFLIPKPPPQLKKFRALSRTERIGSDVRSFAFTLSRRKYSADDYYLACSYQRRTMLRSIGSYPLEASRRTCVRQPLEPSF
jgi:hypothetical protein